MLDAVLRSLVIYGLAISVASGAALKHHQSGVVTVCSDKP